MRKHLNIVIIGRVQGVFFRKSAQDQARKLGINGIAQNLPDGNVYIEAEGGEEYLKKFTDWCKKGPPLAKVEKVEITESDIKDFRSFDIF